MKIGYREVGKGHPAYLIAEAGIEHRGMIDRAMHLVDMASKTVSGADAIKFQVFTDKDELFCPLDGDDVRWPHWVASIMPSGAWDKVRERANEHGLDFLASVFQRSALEMVKSWNMPVWKVASRAAASFPYKDVDGPFLISNGFAGEAISMDVPGGALVLDCNPKYPTPIEETTWDDHTDGYSMHCSSSWPAIHALARGACVVEAHIKMDKYGRDAESAIWPEQFALIAQARDVFASMRPR